MNKIVALWAVPRSTSTAFEWMMRQRGDLTCLHEPYGEAWYQGDEPLWPRLTAESVRTPGLTLAGVHERLKEMAKTERVFSKDFPLYIDHMWNDELFDMFNHSFLIRDPAKTIASMFKHWPDFHIKETGFKEQRALFDIITERNGGTPPPVIDSDDVLADPFGVVQLWCKAVGIPFIEEALSWEPGPRNEVSWWDGGSFHELLRNSDGLKPQPRRDAKPVAEMPQRVQDVYAEVMPHYQHLYAHRLTP